MSNGQIRKFIENHFLHFNAAALVDASKGYEKHLAAGGKMMVTLAGAMSTAEMGKLLARMIREDKIHIISCTGANLEEDIMNLVAHSHYQRVPDYRQLTANPPRRVAISANSPVYLAFQQGLGKMKTFSRLTTILALVAALSASSLLRIARRPASPPRAAPNLLPSPDGTT